jgi:hypothetical protein
MITSATTGASQVTVEARVIRADGTVQELGTVAYWHRNPLKRLAWRVSNTLQRLRALIK